MRFWYLLHYAQKHPLNAHDDVLVYTSNENSDKPVHFNECSDESAHMRKLVSQITLFR